MDLLEVHAVISVYFKNNFHIIFSSYLEKIIFSYFLLTVISASPLFHVPWTGILSAMARDASWIVSHCAVFFSCLLLLPCYINIRPEIPFSLTPLPLNRIISSYFQPHFCILYCCSPSLKHLFRLTRVANVSEKLPKQNGVTVTQGRVSPSCRRFIDVFMGSSEQSAWSEMIMRRSASVAVNPFVSSPKECTSMKCLLGRFCT